MRLGISSYTYGKTLHLVFSGDDYFSVRQATLTTW